MRDHDDDLHADDDHDNADPAGVFGVVRVLVGPDVLELAIDLQRLRERRGRLFLRSTVVQRERMRPGPGPVFVAVERVDDDHDGGPVRVVLHDVNDDLDDDHDQGLRVVVRLEVFERRRGVLQSIGPVRADLPLSVARRYSLGRRLRHVCNAVRWNHDHDDNHDDNHNDNHNDNDLDDHDDPSVWDLHIRPGVRIRRSPGRELHGRLRLRLLDERTRRDRGPVFVDRDDVGLLLRLDNHDDNHDHNDNDLDDNDDRRPVVRSFSYSG